MDFNEFWENGCFGEYHDIYTKNLAGKFYQAGRQCKQAEIDELQKRINEALELINNQHDTSTIKFVRYAINKILKGESK